MLSYSDIFILNALHETHLIAKEWLLMRKRAISAAWYICSV